MISRASAFTLLEVMIALILLALVSGVVGVRIGKGVEEKRFHSSVERLFTELQCARHLAIQMQADWFLTLRNEKGRIFLLRSCPEHGQESTVDWPASCQLFWNREKKSEIVIHFAATGKVAPKGYLQFSTKSKEISWEIPALFQITENDHP